MTAPVLLGLIAAIVTGVVLVILGLRGKRLNRNPTCGDCRFDLSGRPEGTITCPECGAGLKRPGAIRIGQRRKRPLFIVGGGVLAGFPMLLVGTAAFAMLTGSEVDSYKPFWLLSWEARYVSAARSQSIATEIGRRIAAKTLAPEQRAAAVAVALDIQGDPTRPWCHQWGDLIEDARMDGKLSDEDQARFRRQAAVLEWTARPRVRAGGVLPVVAKLKEARVGSQTMMQGIAMLKSMTVDGEKAARGKPQMPGMEMWGFPGMGVGQPVGWFQLTGSKNPWGMGAIESQVQVPVSVPAGAGAGRHECGVTISVRPIDMNAMRAGFNWNTMNEQDSPDASEHSTSMSFEVVGEGEPAIELVEPTPDLAAKLKAQLGPQDVQVWAGMGRSVMAQFSVADLPVDVAFDVHISNEGRTWKIGSFTSGTGWEQGFYGYGGPDKQRHVSGPARGLKGTTVTVTLKPSPGAAERTLEVTKIYNGELVFENVALGGEDAVRPATTSGPGILDLLFGR
ncbi:MAG: hypothetical protein WD749_12605 [Phycisphaerales bacterium]